jgi:hypothetical protein
MRADVILLRKRFPPYEIERREAPTARTASKKVRRIARNLSGRNESDGFQAQCTGEGWVALGLVQSRARSTAGYAESPRSPFFIALKVNARPAR